METVTLPNKCREVMNKWWEAGRERDDRKMGKGRERNGMNGKRARKGREADGWRRQQRRARGTGTKVGHYGSVYDSSLSLMDTEAQMQLHSGPEGEGVNWIFTQNHAKHSLRNVEFIFSVVRYYLYQSDRKSHPCKTCRFLYFLSCWSPPVYQNSNIRRVSWNITRQTSSCTPYIILLIPLSFCRNLRLLHISLQNGFSRLEPYCQFPGNGVFKCLFEWRVDGRRAGE